MAIRANEVDAFGALDAAARPTMEPNEPGRGDRPLDGRLVATALLEVPRNAVFRRGGIDVTVAHAMVVVDSNGS